MVKLATPVSTLFEDSAAARKISSLSCCLEAREHSPEADNKKQNLFHFEHNIVSPWNVDEKKIIKSALSSNRGLRLITFHIASSCTRPKIRENMFFPGGRRLSRSEMLSNALDNIEWVRRYIGQRPVDIAVENINYYPTGAYRHITDADFISELVRDNGIFFVFDIAHARISAHNSGVPYKKYRSGLPLEGLIQIHISRESKGPSGLYYDAHRAPDKELFNEVTELLDRYPVRYLTVEYYKDAEVLLKVLKNYKKLCSRKRS